MSIAEPSPTTTLGAAPTGEPAPVPDPPPAEELKRRTSLPREGRYWLLASGGLWVVGWLKGINLILLLAYLLLLLWGLNWLAARRALHGVRARRVVRGPVFAGTPFLWEVEASAEGRRALTGWELVDAGPDHALSWFVLNLRPGEQVRLRRDVTLPRRGVYPCGPLRADSSFPFGLVRLEVEFGAADQLVVLPRLGTLHAGRLRRWLMQTARPDERVRRARRRLAQEVEFHGLRQFRAGDSPRWIHWRTSARSGELMVREFDQGTHHDLVLIVEPYAAAGASNSSLEAALSLAATLCWAWAREEGDRVVLAVAGAEPVTVPGRDGPGAVIELLECLARAEGTPTPDFAALAKRMAALALPQGPALLVSSRPGGGRSAEELSRRLERPVALIDAAAPPSFYQPPA
jgi:uncharacterized protein (DUF58 family)